MAVDGGALDPSNPVVRLLAAGMAAEAEARRDDAKVLFEQAWDASRDDFEACMAAHYLARCQPDVGSELHWNEEALRRADAAADERVRGFYASLHLNVGHSLEQLGRTADACRHYALGTARLADVPAGPYANLVRMGLEAGSDRTRGA